MPPMRRRDFIPLLLDRPHTPSQLAQAARLKPREVAGDVPHLLKSLRHLPYVAEMIPARCRGCGFEFDVARFVKPSRCPRCRSTWIAEPELVLRDKVIPDSSV